MTKSRKRERRIGQFSLFVTRHRLAFIILLLIICGFVSIGITRLKTEVIIKDLFPYNHKYLKIVERFAEVFGSGGSGAVIAVRSLDGDVFQPNALEKVKNITAEVELWDEVYRVLTKSMASRSIKVVKTLAQGEISVVPLMWPDVPKTKEEMDELKYNVFSNPAYDGLLVSNDGSAAIIFTEFRENISYEKSFSLLKDIVERYSDKNTSIHIIGFPVLMGYIYNLKDQMKTVFIITIVIILIILFIIFRNIAGMVAPLTMGLICTGFGLGFAGWTGINFSPLLYVLAFLVGARMLSNSVQITHRYIEEYSTLGNREQACFNTMRTMLIPNIAAVSTDAAGFLVLLFAKIILMQQIAIIMSFWMMTIALSGVLVPLICTYIPIKRGSHEQNGTEESETFLSRISTAIARFSIGKGRIFIGAAVIAILCTSLWKTTKLEIGDPTPGSPLLWNDHVYNRDQELINQIFNASSENLVLYFEGKRLSVYEPGVFETFESFVRYMKDRLPDIYKSSDSLMTMVKMVNLTLHDGDQVWYQLPSDRPMLGALVDNVRTNMDVSSFSRYMDLTLKRAQITLFFSDHTSKNLIRIRDAAYDFFKDRTFKTKNGEFKLAGGQIGMQIALNEEMKESHFKIDSMVLLTIFIMCSFCFRSFVAGIMLTFPLIFANLMAFAYMATNGIGLSINTLPVAAIGVGVGVDFAIYLYSRCAEEYDDDIGYFHTIMRAVKTSGQAVIFSGMTLVLSIIPWYFLSEMKFQAQMGFFLAMLLFTNVVLALTLHPLMIYLFKPKFLKNR